MLFKQTICIILYMYLICVWNICEHTEKSKKGKASEAFCQINSTFKL